MKEGRKEGRIAHYNNTFYQSVCASDIRGHDRNLGRLSTIDHLNRAVDGFNRERRHDPNGQEHV